MTNPPLNPDALEKACKSIWESKISYPYKWENTTPETKKLFRQKMRKYVNAYLAAAQPEVNND